MNQKAVLISSLRRAVRSIEIAASSGSFFPEKPQSVSEQDKRPSRNKESNRRCVEWRDEVPDLDQSEKRQRDPHSERYFPQPAVCPDPPFDLFQELNDDFRFRHGLMARIITQL